MRTLTVLSMMTLDGVIQGPGGLEEDSSGGFSLGGWTWPYRDEVGGEVVRAELNQRSDYLLGRRTYENWASYWPHHAADWPGIMSGTKYVLSSTVTRSDWDHTVFIRTVEDIRRIKESDGPDLQVWGSSKLVQLLFAHDLVDELRFKLYPLVLGTGKRLFGDGSVPTSFTLVESSITTTGMVIVHYRRAGLLSRAGTAG